MQIKYRLSFYVARRSFDPFDSDAQLLITVEKTDSFVTLFGVACTSSRRRVYAFPSKSDALRFQFVKDSHAGSIPSFILPDAQDHAKR